MDNETRQHLQESIKRWKPLTDKLSIQAKLEIYNAVLYQRDSATSAMLDLSMAIMADRDCQMWQNQLLAQNVNEGLSN